MMAWGPSNANIGKHLLSRVSLGRAQNRRRIGGATNKNTSRDEDIERRWIPETAGYEKRTA